MHGSLSNYAADRRVCVHSSAPVDVDAVLHKIFTQDRQKLLHYLVSRLGDQDDAEDVFSDFAFRVVRKVGGLKDAKALNS